MQIEAAVTIGSSALLAAIIVTVLTLRVTRLRRAPSVVPEPSMFPGRSAAAKLQQSQDAAGRFVSDLRSPG